ncbi:MAG: hypothetical protein MI723_01490 [Caulobacterales bacterium]|nr:hypothetical protein [Caulobacterales bacterium]
MKDVLIPTEAIGSIPRPLYLYEAIVGLQDGRVSPSQLADVIERAVAETIKALEATGSRIITDGEQAKSSFVTYPLDGAPNLEPNGFVIPFEDGHTRQLPILTEGPFRYQRYAGEFAARTRRMTKRKVKQAVISPTALSLIYPDDGVEGYSRDTFLADLVDEAERDIRSAFDAGADVVQIDFTEGRLSAKIDPTLGLLREFVELINTMLERFSDAERRCIGIHTCPGSDHNARHSGDVDYKDLLPDLFRIKAGRFYIQLASEPERAKVLDLIRRERRPSQLTFVGVIDPCDPQVETVDEVCRRVLEAMDALDGESVGACDDCGFSPFNDDVIMVRGVAFAKIKARVDGVALAEQKLMSGTA